MVRRAVATKIGDFAKSLEKEFVLTDIIALFKQLTTDDQVLLINPKHFNSLQGPSPSPLSGQSENPGPFTTKGRNQDPFNPDHHSRNRGQVLEGPPSPIKELR